MLKGILNNNLQNNNQIAQTTGADKTGLFTNKNPYEKIDKNLLVDQLDISNDAMKLYEKDLDIKKFAQLALSDPEDLTHNKKVASQIESGEIEFDDKEIIDRLFNNPKFFSDLNG